MRENRFEAFDPIRCMTRNEQVARDRYGLRLTKDRRVEGTTIWFDDAWRMHTGEMEKEEG